MLLAIQDSAVVSGHVLPASDLNGVSAQNAGDVVAQTSHAVIGYKGQRSVTWIKEVFKGNGEGPAEVSSSIPISFSYILGGKVKESLCYFQGGRGTFYSESMNI